MKKFYGVSYVIKENNDYQHGISIVAAESEQEILENFFQHFTEKQRTYLADIFAVELNLEELGLKEI